MLHGVSHTQKSLSLSTRKSAVDKVQLVQNTSLTLTWNCRPSSVKCGWLSVGANKAFHSHRELGEHILCTARGCSRAHRLGRKKHTFTSMFEVCTVGSFDTTRAKVSYRACAPCGSCSCPSGSAFRSQCGRRWCCKCRRSPSPWPSPCSLPRVEADKSAATRTSHIRYDAGCSETVFFSLV